MLAMLGLVAGLMSGDSSALRGPWLQDHPVGGRILVQDKNVPVERFWHVLNLDSMMLLLHDEATQEAAWLEAEGPIAGRGLSWSRIVGRIHDPRRMSILFRQGMERALTQIDVAKAERGLGFYEQALGQRIVALETMARRAMLDDRVEAQAHAAFAMAVAAGAPRAEQILRLIAEADLVAPNVAGGLNAAMAFSRGFAEGGGADMPLTQHQLAAEAWAQQQQVEADATRWLQGFLMFAYAPLSDAELEVYIGFATSPEGQALAGALFGASDAVLGQTSYDMGVAAALRLRGRQL